MKTRVGVIGSSGMLGAMVVDYLSRQSDIDLTAVARDADFVKEASKQIPHINWQVGGTDHMTGACDFTALKGCQWIINAIGIIKPLIKDTDPDQVRRAIWVNSLLPHTLADEAGKSGAKIIQIATDCVYSGRKGKYTEQDIHDAEDVYGKTKSLGETFQPNVAHIRCSIIGPEVRGHKSLLHWFLRQPANASVKGFTNHSWNGVTTLHYAKLCHGIIRENLSLPHLQHIVPSGTITKADMLRTFARCYQRSDIAIQDAEAAVVIDRTVATGNPELNGQLWRAAGYAEPPTVEAMIEEMSRYNLTLKA